MSGLVTASQGRSSLRAAAAPLLSLDEKEILRLQGTVLDATVARIVFGRKVQEFPDSGPMMYDPFRMEWVYLPRFHARLELAHGTEEKLLALVDTETYPDMLATAAGGYGVRQVRATATERCRACLLVIWHELKRKGEKHAKA